MTKLLPHSPEEGEDHSWQSVSSASTLEEFCHGWLALQCRMVEGATDGVVVLGSAEPGRFAPIATWPPGKTVDRQLGEAAEKALSERRSLVVKRESPDDRPTSFQVAYPLQVADRLHGVVALDVGDRDEEQIQTIVGQLANGSAWLEGLLARNNGRHENTAADATANRDQPGASPSSTSPSAERLQLKAVLDVVATTIGEDRFQAAGTALVTELATRLQCERVAFGVVIRKRSVLRALSHSAQFGKKTNLTRALERAMDEAFDQEASILFPQSSVARGAGFRITRAHTELSKDHGSGAIASVPLVFDGEIRAVLTLERPGDLPFDEGTLRYCETLGSIVGPLLELRRRDERILLGKTADSGWKVGQRLFGPGHLGWKLAGILLFAAALFLCFATGDYRVTADTVLEGSIQRAAVAPFNGFIATADQRAGDRVEKDAVLCTLEDRELDLEHVRVRSQHEQLVKQYDQALAGGNRAQVRIVGTQIAQARARLEQIQAQLGRLKITAPFDGIIVTGDLSQSIGAPAQRGDVLFEIAPLGDYRVIQEVDERDIDEIHVGQSGNIVLATFPNEPIPFEVTKITPVSTTDQGRNYFRVESSLLSESDLTRLRPGMEGISKIDIDRRKLVWIWTHRAVDWVRLTLWSWLP